jgi:DNA invertase Pin-like site-specific DNA recombinase/ssDNA-binding Zn-finger/Zn-ribbon topoisomerase 1
MRDYYQNKNLTLHAEHSFKESSIKDHREKFLQVIEEIKKSKEKIVLVVETIDRLQRSFKESVLLDELRKQDKVEIHFVRENLVISANSNSSEIQRWDSGVFLAKSYVLQISDNVKRSIKQKLAQGELSTKAPVGYLNVTYETTGKKTIILDKERASLVKRIFEEYAASNQSVSNLVKYSKQIGLTAVGRQELSKSYMCLILRNPFYIGQMKCKHGIFPHKYPTWISKETFDCCQDILSGKVRIQRKFDVRSTVLRGMVTCSECGGTMGIDYIKGKYVYLYCSNAKKRGTCTNNAWINEAHLLKKVENVFRNINLPDYIIEETEKHLKQVNNSEKEQNKEIITSLRSDYDNCQKRIDALIDIKLDNSIGGEDYKRKMDELKQKQLNLQSEIQGHTAADDGFNETLLTILELARNAYSLYTSSDAVQKRQLLKFVCPNLILEGKK